MTAPRSSRLRAAFLRLAAAILVALSFSGLAAGGQPAKIVRRTGAETTTHRAGDLVVYRFSGPYLSAPPTYRAYKTREVGAGSAFEGLTA